MIVKILNKVKKRSFKAIQNVKNVNIVIKLLLNI
jgi:hypothetical protein